MTNVRAAELLQTHFRGEETDVEVLRPALTTAETLWPDFAPAVVSSVLGAAREHGIVRLKTVRNEVAVLLDNEREARGTLESIIEFAWSEFLGQKDPDSASIERLRTKVEQLVEHHAELPGWIDFRRAWQEVREPRRRGHPQDIQQSEEAIQAPRQSPRPSGFPESRPGTLRGKPGPSSGCQAKNRNGCGRVCVRLIRELSPGNEGNLLTFFMMPIPEGDLLGPETDLDRLGAP